MKAPFKKILLFGIGMISILLMFFMTDLPHNTSSRNEVKKEKSKMDINQKYSYSFSVFQW